MSLSSVGFEFSKEVGASSVSSISVGPSKLHRFPLNLHQFRQPSFPRLGDSKDDKGGYRVVVRVMFIGVCTSAVSVTIRRIDVVGRVLLDFDEVPLLV